MKDLFHSLLKYLNTFPLDYKKKSINDFLIKLGYKEDSLEDAKTIKAIIQVLENRQFIECYTVLFNELFAEIPLKYNPETTKHDLPDPHTLSNVDIEVSLTSIGKLYIEGREREIKQIDFNTTQKRLTTAIMASTVAYCIISGLTFYIQYKQYKQVQKSPQEIETKIKSHILTDTTFLKALKYSLNKP